MSGRSFALSITLASSLSTFAYADLAPYQSEMPRLNATVFAPNKINTERFEINTVLNKNGDNVIFTRCDDDFTHCKIMHSDFVDGEWQTPTVMPFSGEYQDADPFYSGDYKDLYYISKRPADVSSTPSEVYNLWRVSKTTKGWSEPELLPISDTSVNDYYPSMTQDNHLFFVSLRNDKQQLYYSKFDGSKYLTPTAIPQSVYGDNGRVGDSVISRDGKTLIMSIRGRADSAGRGDLYISRKVKNEWTAAESLGAKVNTADHEFTPIFSPDDKTLYFTRIEDGIGTLYQIDMAGLAVSLAMTGDGELLYQQQANEALKSGATLAGIPLDTEWKKSIYKLSANAMQHPAWGMNHSERNYLLTMKLAEMENMQVDADVVFAAAFLHDMATFHPWSNGTDHSTRAASLVPELLNDIHFPENKINAVQELILGHMFHNTPVDKPVAQFFHDADTLDFLGVTGITRILSLNNQGGWATNSQVALQTLTGFSERLPQTLISKSAVALGDEQLVEMQSFLNSLKADTQQFKAP